MMFLNHEKVKYFIEWKIAFPIEFSLCNEFSYQLFFTHLPLSNQLFSRHLYNNFSKISFKFFYCSININTKESNKHLSVSIRICFSDFSESFSLQIKHFNNIVLFLFGKTISSNPRIKKLCVSIFNLTRIEDYLVLLIQSGWNSDPLVLVLLTEFNYDEIKLNK